MQRRSCRGLVPSLPLLLTLPRRSPVVFGVAGIISGASRVASCDLPWQRWTPALLQPGGAGWLQRNALQERAGLEHLCCRRWPTGAVTARARAGEGAGEGGGGGRTPAIPPNRSWEGITWWEGVIIIGHMVAVTWWGRIINWPHQEGINWLWGPGRRTTPLR